MTPLEILRDQLIKLAEQRAALSTEMRTALTTAQSESRELTDAENTAYDEQRGRLVKLDSSIDALQQRVKDAEEDERRSDVAGQILANAGQAGERRSGGARVTSEPMTYNRHNQTTSYFMDLARSSMRNDTEAAARLQRHAQELDVELPAREKRRDAAARQEMRGVDNLKDEHRESAFERRANPNRTDGQGGYFVPPLWLVDEFIDFPRFGRTVANDVQNLTLPGGTDSVNLPKINTGTKTAVQTADGGAVTSVDMTDTFVNAPVRTIAGQQDVAMQLLDQSPVSFDRILYQDLIADLNQQVDLQVLNGTGLNGQALGIFNVSGINSVTSTAGSTTLITLYGPMIKLLSQIAKNRKMMPTGLYMTPTRWFWGAATLDSQNRPLILPDANSPMNPMALQSGATEVEGPVGRLLSTRISVDGNIPVTFGGGTEDKIFALRASDLYLWEGAMRTRVLQEVLSGTLQVRFQVFQYFAFMPHRRPESISVLSGSDLAASFTAGF